MVTLKIITLKEKQYNDFVKTAEVNGYLVLTNIEQFVSLEESYLIQCLKKGHIMERKKNEIGKCIYCSKKTKLSYWCFNEIAKENQITLQVDEEGYQSCGRKNHGVSAICHCGRAFKFKIREDESPSKCRNCAFGSEVVEKRKKTYREKTGYDIPMHNPDVKEKIKKNMVLNMPHKMKK